MKTTIKTLVSLFAMSSLAMAGTEAAAAKATDAAKPATEAVKPAMATSPKLATVTAKIVAVDNATKTITLSEMVKGVDGKEMAKEVKMTWNETTKLMFHGADAKTPAATLTDLKAGETVTVKVNDANAMLANEIHIVKAMATDAKPVTK